jgi:RNA polymerase sigma factor (sigma-70 family)
MMSDLELLNQYVRHNRQEAFAALLDRHLKLVYSAAVRQVRSPELAEEVAQSVFTDLASNAGKLEPGTILTAWLYRVTRRAAIDVVRRESRRQLREQIAYEMNNMNANSTEWSAIEPLLDEAMESLNQADRTAILLRFFENKSLREVGQTLGTSEDAAQKRISRALDLLRECFSKQGRTVVVGSLAALLTAHAAQSAPVGLKASILNSVALSGTSASSIGAAGITKTIAMTTLQKAIIGATLAAAVGTGFYEAQRASVLDQQMQTLQRQAAAAPKPDDSLRQQLDEANRQLAALKAQNEKLSKDAADVLRLRGEIAHYRDAKMSTDPAGAVAKSWLDRVNQLKDRAQQTPNARIPEFQFLTDQDWLDAAKNNLNTDEDYKKALSNLRNTAETEFINTELKAALNRYATANSGQFPTALSQLQQYFNQPVDDSVLQRWEIVPKSIMPNIGVGDMIVTQVGPVDSDYDNRYAVGLTGWGTDGPDGWEDPTAETSLENILKPALNAYQAANNGMEPTDPSQIQPYLTTPEQQAALQKLMKRAGSGPAVSGP